MKIGILTLPLHTNYGGILQAYALQKYLQKFGHEVCVLNRIPCPSFRVLIRRIGSLIKTAFKRFLLGKHEYVIVNPMSIYYHTMWQGYDVLPFVKEKINLTRPIRSTYALKRIVNKYKLDCCIVGSDQVWRLAYCPFIPDYFLKGIGERSKQLKKIVYAASFGTTTWDYSEDLTKECKKLVQEFNAISVREDYAVEMCKNHLNVNVEHLIDPTMLLHKEDYITLFMEQNKTNPYFNVMSYVLDECDDISRILNKLSGDGLSLYSISTHVLYTHNNPRAFQPSVEQWLKGLYNAEFVVTDSFHACVFSILFEKPFVVFANKTRGISRIKSLLTRFDLCDRLIFSYDDFVMRENELKAAFDYKSVYDKLDNFRRKSMSFFENAGVCNSFFKF